MGLNFSYLLYFKRVHLLNAFHGLEEIAEEINPPIMNYFPNYANPISLIPNGSEKTLLQQNDSKLDFATVLKFDLDEVIQEYITDRGFDETYRSPPDEEHDQVTIGFVYLTIYFDISERVSENKGAEDLVLFELGTTGTQMSLLFDNSTSIRNTFIEFLEKNQGICGVFNREVDWPELFWLKGKRYSKSIRSAFMLPEEIEAELKKGW